jgi:hypothetical protein
MATEHEHDRDPDLHWLALCYVAGEMGRDEAEAFEGRLDRDQASREAVAQAVELAGAIAALASEAADGQVRPMPRRVPRPLPIARLAAGLALAAAACLAWLLVAPGGPSPQTTADAGRVDAGKGTPSPTVTLAWSKLRQVYESEDGGKPEDGLLAWNDLLPGPTDPELAPPAEAEGASDHGLPPWLLDAASLVRDGRRDAETAPATVKER